MKKYILLMMTTLLMTVFGSSPAWAEDATFTFSSKWGSNSQTVSPITITFVGGHLHAPITTSIAS